MDTTTLIILISLCFIFEQIRKEVKHLRQLTSCIEFDKQLKTNRKINKVK